MTYLDQYGQEAPWPPVVVVVGLIVGVPLIALCIWLLVRELTGASDD